MSTQVVTLTLNPAVDRSVTVDRVVSEHKLRCTDPAVDPGGGGINVTRVLNRLGTSSQALWTQGGDMGALLGRLLSKEGVPHRPIQIADQTRENFSVFESGTSLQYRFNLPGPTFTEDCDREVVETIAGLDPAPAFLVLSGSLPLGVEDHFYRRVVEAAPEGTKVVVDTSGKALKASLEGPVFAAKPNLRELGLLVDRELESDEDIIRAARTLVEGGCEVLLVSLGAGGALVVGEEGTSFVRSPTVPIRSKVGAGDSMVGGFIHGLSSGLSLADAARMGVASGAATVMTDGSQLCRAKDVHRLFNEISEKT
ncbi:MAG: 1-phosphofructokinase family hexose kinase [Myxococcota bacterium]